MSRLYCMKRNVVEGPGRPRNTTAATYSTEELIIACGPVLSRRTAREAREAHVMSSKSRTRTALHTPTATHITGTYLVLRQRPAVHGCSSSRLRPRFACLLYVRGRAAAHGTPARGPSSEQGTASSASLVPSILTMAVGISFGLAQMIILK